MSLLTPDRSLSAGPRCDKPVQGDGVMSYHCSLPTGHESVGPPEDPQPCYAVESGRSTRAWDAWKRRQDRRSEVGHPEQVYINCPNCGEKAMQVHSEERVGLCGNCGAEAEFQQDLPDQPTETIEDILADQPEPARVLVPREDDRPEVLVANEAAIKAGDIHNPFDAQCVNSDDRGVQWHIIEGERCYICRPEDADEPLPEPAAEETDEDIQQAAKTFEEELEERGLNTHPVPLLLDLPQPTKQREGDQVLPVGGDRAVQDWIIETMEESKRVGIERYGQPLMTFDGRSNIRDLADELRDAFVYISKMQMMAEADKETLVEMVGRALVEEIGPLADHGVAYRYAEVAVDRILDWVLIQRLGPDTVLP